MPLAGRVRHDLALLEPRALCPAGRPRREKSTRRARVGIAARGGIVGVEDGDVFGALAREEPRLGRGVVLEARVAVEVVGRDVRQDRDVRAEAVDRLELERGDFAHEVAARRSPRESPRAARRCFRRARRAAPPRSSVSAIQVVVVDLPLVPVTATQRFRPAPRPRRCARRSRSPPGPAVPARAPRRPPARPAGRPARSRASRRPPETRRPGLRRRSARRGGRAPRPPRNLPRGRLSPMDTATPRVQERLGQGAAAAGESENGDRPRQVRGRRGGGGGHRQRAHRSFSVERPITAKRMARIQKRMITRDSAQPSSSK